MWNKYLYSFFIGYINNYTILISNDYFLSFKNLLLLPV